jgi:Xaa-Pro aminopeptidase
MRLREAYDILKQAGKLPFFCSTLTNVRYLTGFAGSYGNIVITEKGCFFITDTRYQEYAENLMSGNAEVVIQSESLLKTIERILGGSDTLFVEENTLSLADYNRMRNDLRTEIMPAGDVVETMRMIKDDSEISRIRAAVEVTDRCAAFVAETASCAMTEWDLSVAIENFYRKNQCRKSAFDSIIASGPDSSMPHYIPSMKKKIIDHAPLLVDMGAFRDDYNSDLTRTFFMSSISADLRKIYDIVLEAQLKAVAAVKPGMTAGDLDAVARDHIETAGYGSFFGHSLGHGVGLEIHELPSIRRGNETVLREGMVITIEPGIYIPGLGGVRIEDTVVVCAQGCDVLTKYMKEPVIIK